MKSWFALPLALTVIALISAFVTGYLFSLAAIQYVLVGLSVFAALAGFVSLLLTNRQKTQTERRIADLIAFESDMLKRIRPLETNAANTIAEDNLSERVAQLEDTSETLARLLQEKGGQLGAIDNSDDDEAFEDEKVVRLKPGHNQKSGQKSDVRTPIKKTDLEELLSEGWMSIRLQPIFNLLDRKIVGVEAFAYLNSNNNSLSIAALANKISDLQKSELDLRAIHELSKVVRAMEEDGQKLPVHFRPVSIKASPDAHWRKLAQALEADDKLTEVLVVAIGQADFRKLTDKPLKKLTRLREIGVELCLGDVTGTNEAAQIVGTRQFVSVKIDASVLLSYRGKESELFADRFLPSMAEHRVDLFVDGIDKAHHASQLIDLDVADGQGDYMSPARLVRIYERANGTNGTA